MSDIVFVSLYGFLLRSSKERDLTLPRSEQFFSMTESKSSICWSSKKFFFGELDIVWKCIKSSSSGKCGLNEISEFALWSQIFGLTFLSVNLIKIFTVQIQSKIGFNKNMLDEIKPL